ncbi:MAG: protein-L-isoaspartate O-methyltransferase family protein [Betaproteobacteria bacterium]
MNFELARHNMVEQQIRPWDVLDPAVLETVAAVHREDFVPPAYRSLAFTDMEVPLDIAGFRTGEVMLAPKVEARMLQAANPHPADSVLEIGTGSGYMAALLARHAQRIVSCEVRAELVSFARDNLARAGVGQVTVKHCNGLDEVAGGARFNLIVLSGSVSFVPDSLLQALHPGGRIIAIVGEPPVMTAQLITRASEARFTAEPLFETIVTPLVGFPRKERFVF